MIGVALLPQVWLSDHLLAGPDFGRAAAIWDLRPYPLDAPLLAERSPEYTQIRTRLPENPAPQDDALVLIDASGSARIFLNNIRVLPPSGDGLGHDRVQTLPLPAAFRQDGQDTLDLIYPAAPRQLRPPLALVGPGDLGESTARRYLDIAFALRSLTVAAGLLAALLCFLILALFPRCEARLWLRGSQALLLSLAVAPVLLATGLAIPAAALLAVASLGAAAAGIIALILARQSATGAAGVVTIALPPAFCLGAAAMLVIGWAGAYFSPPFSVWPAAPAAMGTGLALAFFLDANVQSLRLGARLVQAALDRIRARETLIRDQQETISQQSESLEAEIRHRAVLEERQRFSRDIHDGLGGSLLSLLVQVRTGKLESQDIESALEANLDELRMMVDSMDRPERSLNAALNTIEVRIRELFSHAGISLEWNTPENRLPESVSPDYILHLYRILQEAGSNIVRHSKARRAAYSFGWDPENQRLAISIINDGSKQTADTPSVAGNGLRNMAQRVEQMSGEFEAGPRPDGGWSIRISLPV